MPLPGSSGGLEKRHVAPPSSETSTPRSPPVATTFVPETSPRATARAPAESCHLRTTAQLFPPSPVRARSPPRRMPVAPAQATPGSQGSGTRAVTANPGKGAAPEGALQLLPRSLER